ncbi:MAG: hypothetical protein C0601_12120 [Candidatus Muiribacterium halophilum]|uniref:peptidylprolyl isomerase n=1 Tax=Muiribacterium halophilum TaxID=2053465 RepID=A0A2N5ZAM2_MUIH1|nr:MAG: hypothetical protein C0601_12120 [Candidatus Muirbacterium halophilum]
MLKKLAVVLVITISMLSLVACDATKKSADASTPNKITKKGVDTMKTEKDPNAVLAEYKDGKVTVAEFDKEIEKIPPMYRVRLLKDPEGKKKLLERYVNFKLAGRRIDKENYRDKIKDRIEKTRESLILERFMGEKRQEINQSTKASDEDCKKYFDDNQDKFKQEAEVKASHILLPEGEENRKKLVDLKKKIESGEVKFEDAAKQYSTCPSKARGGDLGFFTKDRMVKPFADAAFAMKEGEISDPVKTRFGWHLIYLTGKKAAGSKNFDSVKEDIRKNLSSEKQGDAFNEWKDGILKKYNISYEKSGDVLSTINGKPAVRQEQLDNEMKNLPDYMKDFYKKDNNSQKLLASMTEKDALLMEAKKVIKPDSDEIKDSIDQFIHNAYIEDYVNKNSTLKDGELKAYYQDNNRVFEGNYIFLAIQNHPMDQIEKLKKEIMERLNKGESFEALVKEYSDDPGKDGTGYLGEFMRSDIFPEIAEKLKTIKEGGTTGFVNLPNGAALLKVKSITKKSFEEIKDRLQAKLEQKKKADAFEALMKDLSSTYDVKYHYDKL